MPAVSTEYFEIQNPNGTIGYINSAVKEKYFDESDQLRLNSENKPLIGAYAGASLTGNSMWLTIDSGGDVPFTWSEQPPQQAPAQLSIPVSDEGSRKSSTTESETSGSGEPQLMTAKSKHASVSDEKSSRGPGRPPKKS